MNNNINISLIAAISKNNVIGKDNKLLWKLSTDMKYFKSTTTGHCVIMGRKTFESFGAKTLPNRTNVILSSNKIHLKEGEGYWRTTSIPSALDLCEGLNKQLKITDEEIFIIGGGEIYKETIDLANKLYITHVDVDIEGDTYFPEIDKKVWTLLSSEQHGADEKNEYPFVICVYERIEVYTGEVTSFNDLENELFGEQDTPERDTYEAEYKIEVKNNLNDKIN